MMITNKSTSLTLYTFPYGLETSRPMRIKGNQTLPKLSIFRNVMQNSIVKSQTPLSILNWPCFTR